MEELLKIMYRNFINEENTSTSKELRIIREQMKDIDNATEKLESILNKDLFSEIYDLIYDGISDLIESSFVAGFAQCAKMMSNGKIDFFSNDNEKGGNEDE